MTTDDGFVVVGVDHSHAASAALEFALDEGLAHGCPVEVVTAWLWTSPYSGMNHVSTLDEGRSVAAAAQDAALGRALESRRESPVVVRIVVHDNAEHALVHRAEGARMLVVGSSRKGTLSRAVLGSVSEYCVRHAPAPVVVVSGVDERGHRGPAELEAVTHGDGAQAGGCPG